MWIYKTLIIHPLKRLTEGFLCARHTGNMYSDLKKNVSLNPCPQGDETPVGKSRHITNNHQYDKGERNREVIRELRLAMVACFSLKADL